MTKEDIKIESVWDADVAKDGESQLNETQEEMLEMVEEK